MKTYRAPSMPPFWLLLSIWCAICSLKVTDGLQSPTAFTRLPDHGWSHQVRFEWNFPDDVDFMYFEMARNCTDGTSNFVRVVQRRFTDYMETFGMRCSYKVRAVSFEESSEFTDTLHFLYGGLPSAPANVYKLFASSPNKLTVRYSNPLDTGAGDATSITITNFRVEFSYTSDFQEVVQISDSNDGGVFSQEVQLPKGGKLFARVRAANTLGFGPAAVFGNSSSPISVTVIDSPSPPKSVLRVRHTAEYELTFDALPPFDTGIGDGSIPLLGYILEIDDNRDFSSIDFTVEKRLPAPQNLTEGDESTVPLVVGGLPLATPLYARIRCFNLVGTSDFFIVGGMGNLIPPANAAVFAIAVPGPPTVLASFASAPLQLTVVFAAPQDTGSGLPESGLLKVPAGRAMAWTNEDGQGGTKTPAMGLKANAGSGQSTQQIDDTVKATEVPVLKYIIELDDDPAFHSVDARTEIEAAKASEEGRTLFQANNKETRTSMPSGDPLYKSHLHGWNYTADASTAAGTRGTESVSGLEGLYDSLWTQQAWEWFGGKPEQSAEFPPWGTDNSAPGNQFDVPPPADALRVRFDNLVKGKMYHVRVWAFNEVGRGDAGVMGFPDVASVPFGGPTPPLRLRYLKSGVVGCEVRNYTGCTWGGARVRGFPQHASGLNLFLRFESASGTRVQDPPLDIGSLREKAAQTPWIEPASANSTHPAAIKALQPDTWTANFTSLILGFLIARHGVTLNLTTLSDGVLLLGYDSGHYNFDAVVLGDVSYTSVIGAFGGVAQIGPSAMLTSSSGSNFTGGAFAIPNTLSSGILDWSITFFLRADTWTGKRCVLLIPGTGEGSDVHRQQFQSSAKAGNVPDGDTDEPFPDLLGSKPARADLGLCFIDGSPIAIIEQKILDPAGLPFPAGEMVHVSLVYTASDGRLQLLTDGSLMVAWQPTPRLRSRSPWMLLGGALPPANTAAATTAAEGLDLPQTVPQPGPLLPFQGIVDGLRVYSRALSQSDLKRILAVPSPEEELPFRVQAIDVPTNPTALTSIRNALPGQILIRFLPPQDYGAGRHSESWQSDVSSNIAYPNLLPSEPQPFSNANATIDPSPLVEDVTLISHRLEMSLEPDFSTIACVREGYMPIAGNTLRGIIDSQLEIDCENLPQGKFYYVRLASSNVVGFGPAMTFATNGSHAFTSVRASGEWLLQHLGQGLYDRSGDNQPRWGEV